MSTVDEIYEALADDDAFAALPARLKSLVPATRYCVLMSIEDAGGTGFYVDTPRYTRDEVDNFIRSEAEAKRNPFRPLIVEGGLSNRALASATLMSSAELERTEYCNEVWRQYGEDTTHLLFGKLDYQGGYCVLSLQRGRRGEPFSETEVAMVQPLVPHLRRVLGMRAVLAIKNRLAAEALSLAAYATLVTDPSGRLLMASPQGERLLGPAGPLAIVNGRLRARRPASDSRLQDLLHTAGCGVDDHGGAMWLPVAEAQSLRLVATPWREGGRRRVVILIDGDETPDPSTAQLLADLYGLSAAEARTAAALAQGQSPAEIAEDRGVSLATVRTQIHQALGKCEVRSITELVRLAMTLPRFRRR